jgi:hypothetical protein
MRLLALTVAVLATTMSAAFAQQGQNGRYCLTTEDGGRNCGFATMEQCNETRKGVTRDICVRNETSGQNQVRPSSPPSGSGGINSPR